MSRVRPSADVATDPGVRVLDVSAPPPLHGDTLAATTNLPTDPKLNRAQRRARGDYQRADCTVRRVR